MFNTFIFDLQKKLKEPLPGELSHAEFMHKARLESKIKPTERTKKSAVLILFYPKADKIYFPLILRPVYDGTHGGQMALPGGKMELSDENLERTALREAEEEIGIKSLDVKIIGQLTEIYIPVSDFEVRPFVGFLDYTPDFFPDANEVHKIYEIDINAFESEYIKGMQLVKTGSLQMNVPGFQVYDQWLWGATALIINELLTIINK